jgi:hypothetical protein
MNLTYSRYYPNYQDETKVFSAEELTKSVFHAVESRLRILICQKLLSCKCEDTFKIKVSKNLREENDVYQLETCNRCACLVSAEIL